MKKGNNLSCANIIKQLRTTAVYIILTGNKSNIKILRYFQFEVLNCYEKFSLHHLNLKFEKKNTSFNINRIFQNNIEIKNDSILNFLAELF